LGSDAFNRSGGGGRIRRLARDLDGTRISAVGEGVRIITYDAQLMIINRRCQAVQFSIDGEPSGGFLVQTLDDRDGFIGRDDATGLGPSAFDHIGGSRGG
jgi:hypothetical protein